MYHILYRGKNDNIENIMPPTADWTNINLSGTFSDFTMTERGEVILQFNVNGDTYSVIFDITPSCCEIFEWKFVNPMGSPIILDSPVLNTIVSAKLEYTKVQDNDANEFRLFFFDGNNNTVALFVCSNSHNGYYSHSYQIMQGTNYIFYSSL
jgi:hypothetical protein